MNDSSVLQVRLPLSLREQGEAAAVEAGFSSLQEAVRVLIKQFASGFASLRLTLEDSDENRSYLTSKEYLKIIREAREGVKNGETVSFEDMQKSKKKK